MAQRPRPAGRSRSPQTGADVAAAPVAAPPHAASESEAARGFDERAYLEDNPDVAGAIMRGEVRSGYAHYLRYGVHEGRRPGVPAQEARQRVIRVDAAAETRVPARDFGHNLEGLVISRGGGVLVVGWIDDAGDEVDSVRIFGSGWRLTFDGARLGRLRRVDVEQALSSRLHYPYGYYGFIFAAGEVSATGHCQVEVRLSSGRSRTFATEARIVEDTELRDLTLAHVAEGHHFGNRQVEAVAGLDRAAGREMVRFNRHITASLIQSPYVERFGRAGASYDGSLIICLYGKAEFLFLQAALFSAVEGMDRYELIFVSNSPELAESLLSEARASARIYGLDITVVVLMGNAGFGAANNVAVKAARSERILIVNPDVFPRDAGWARRHSAIVASAPRDQTQLFGAALYYGDGSLMHGGMFFEFDSALSLQNGRQRLCQLVRVEHYGKGTPPELPDFTWTRPVPALTGAFMSCDRPWFEHLGGFTHDYVFGHYEDADLCLKSLELGVAPWMQDLKMWHLEGHGSTRLPVHEGGSLVNRWLFSSTWGAIISEDLLGAEPSRDLFDAARAAGPAMKGRA